MKFYVLRHPELGYLKSKKYYNCSWTNDVEKAKKWTWLSSVKSCLTQTERDILRECEIRTIFYNIIAESIT